MNVKKKKNKKNNTEIFSIKCDSMDEKIFQEESIEILKILS